MTAQTKAVLSVQVLYDSVRNSSSGIDHPYIKEVRQLVATEKRQMLSEQQGCFTIKIPRELHADIFEHGDPTPSAKSTPKNACS